GEPTEVEPFAQGRPGFGFELGFGIGGDDAEGIGEGGEGPEDDDGDEGGLADAVAGCDGDLNGFVEVDYAVTQGGEDPDLPRVEDVEFKGGTGFAPGECAEGKGIGVVGDRGEPGDQFGGHGGVG